MTGIATQESPHIKPHIVIVALSLDRGGTERHLAEVMPRLAAKGWRVTLFCIAGRGELADKVVAGGVEVIAPGGADGSHAPAHLSSGKLFAAAARLFAYLVRWRPQIVHTFLPAPYLVGGPIALLTRRPIRIMSRRNQNHYLKKRHLLAKIEHRLHRSMTSLLANSQSIADALIRDEAADPNRVGLIYNGVDLEALTAPVDRQSVRRNLGIGDGDFVAIIVANLISYKGHSDLIDAFGKIRDRLPQQWVLLCAGRDDGLGEELTARASKLGIAANIRLLGSCTQVAELLRSSDVGILSSHEEGFSNAVVEGMAAGLPMIVTDVGGNAEAVRNGIDGLVVKARAPDGLADAILAIAADPGRARAMGESGAARARENFSISSCVERYDVLYRGLLAGKLTSELAPANFPHGSGPD
jgi:glycosyltransferase involved in cell wall biosynthesis